VTATTKPQRRTQESRSAATRARLLEVAVESLYTKGYAATSTTVVAEGAGVSRGAMLHQFPTKVDLMLFVVQAVYEEDIRLYHEALDPIADPKERLRAFPRAVWEVLCRPAGVAVLEIMQGSRSDPVLSERLKPLQKQIEEDSYKQAGALLNWGTRASSPDKSRLLVWAFRGLSIARLLADEPAEIEKSVDLLSELLIATVDPGLIAGAAPPKRPRSKAKPGR
jgi:AcrR family transcriptional regulator